jgi:hypothetical protein
VIHFLLVRRIQFALLRILIIVKVEVGGTQVFLMIKLEKPLLLSLFSKLKESIPLFSAALKLNVALTCM